MDEPLAADRTVKGLARRSFSRSRCLRQSEHEHKGRIGAISVALLFLVVLAVFTAGGARLSESVSGPHARIQRFLTVATVQPRDEQLRSDLVIRVDHDHCRVAGRSGRRATDISL